LRPEREQGITIDVAYKYFSTEKRKYIIADTPGHIQYTRNMFTGASNADLAIILIDARNGLTEQTRRHSIIASILRIPHILVCVNKMDLVGYNEGVFEGIKDEYNAFAKLIGLEHVTFLPVSAFTGENVVHSSVNMPWHDGGTLFEFLEHVEIQSEGTAKQTRFQVQCVIRPQTEVLHDYRGYAGSVLSGQLRKGDRVQVLPLEVSTEIAKIERNQYEVIEAHVGEAVVLHLVDHLDVGRGSSIVAEHELPSTTTTFRATICWMDDRTYQSDQGLLIQQNSFRTKAILQEIISGIDIHSFEELNTDGRLNLNDFCNVIIRTAEPISFDPYVENRKTGSFILIHEHSNATVAAGVIHG
jgi:sulfate adenylyltransferase subunit 1